jgi:hypothetical protein
MFPHPPRKNEIFLIFNLFFCESIELSENFTHYLLITTDRQRKLEELKAQALATQKFREQKDEGE